MKFLAVGTVQPLTPEQQREHLPHEVPQTLKLYLDGVIEQFWVRYRDDGNIGGVIFLLSSPSRQEAKAALDGLTLTAAGLMTFDLMHVGPLAPLGLLLQGK